MAVALSKMNKLAKIFINDRVNSIWRMPNQSRRVNLFELTKF